MVEAAGISLRFCSFEVRVIRLAPSDKTLDSAVFPFITRQCAGKTVRLPRRYVLCTPWIDDNGGGGGNQALDLYLCATAGTDKSLASACASLHHPERGALASFRFPDEVNMVEAAGIEPASKNVWPVLLHAYFRYLQPHQRGTAFEEVFRLS